MLQLDEVDQDLAPASDDGLSGGDVPFRRSPIGGVPGEPCPYGIALRRVADDALINRIDFLFDRFKLVDRQRRPDDPKLFDSGALGENVPTGQDRLIRRNPSGAVIDGADREEESV